MASISSIFADRGTGPYSKALKVKVVAVDGEPLKYRGKDGSQRASFASCVSDGDTVVRLTCYDSTKFAKFKVGTTLVLRDIIRRMDNSQQAVVVTSATKVLISAPISVPDSHTAEGMQMLHPPPADKVTIATALTSPLKKKVSISGKIVQEDESRQVKVNGEEVTIKTVHVEDRTGKAKVTLWRSTAATPVRPGDHVVITDLVVNVYQSATSLSSTTKSTVEKCEAPLVERMIVVEAVGVENGDAELFLDNEETMIVPAELLQQALSIDEEPVDIEMAMTSGPLTFNVKNQGSDIISITKI